MWPLEQGGGWAWILTDLESLLESGNWMPAQDAPPGIRVERGSGGMRQQRRFRSPVSTS